MAKWKDYLKDQGFQWSDNDELMSKNIGFGNQVTVDMLMKGLFEIKKYGKVVYSNYIDNLAEFKKIIDRIC